MQITKEILFKMAIDKNNLQKIIYLETASRERTIKDIELSLVEEILEWNKERGGEFSHKTWKKKEFDKEKHDEEFVDILFFALEMFNFSKMDTFKLNRNYIRKEIFFQDIEQNLIRTVLFKDCGIEFVVDNLVNLLIITAEKFNINIIETFYKKLKINYARFGYDYDIESGEVTKDRFIGYSENKHIICPYCNKIYDDSDNDGYSDGEELEASCSNCGRDFTYNANVDITFDSNKIDRCQDCKYFSEDTQYCEKEDDYLNFNEYACGYFKEKIKG